MENKTEPQEQAQEQQQEYVTVPRGTTVNKEKYERAVAAKEAAEARTADLEKQIAELTAKGNDAQAAIDEFKAKVDADAKQYAADREKLERELAIKDKIAELLKAECIDPESGIASLKDDETIEALKERKPHLFKQPAKASSLAPKDQPKSATDELTTQMRSVFGLT